MINKLLRKLAMIASMAVIAGSLAQTSPALPKPRQSTERLPAAKPVDYGAYAMTHPGDPVRGKALFLDEQRLGCTRCHMMHGEGGRAGPDLFAIGDKFGRREIIDSILFPSATIAVGYSATTIETESGDEFTGIIKQVTDQWVELMGIDGKVERIPTRAIQSRRTSDISFMPEGLHLALTPAEFTDLVDFLVTLKQPESTELTLHGMPPVILESPAPVQLQPFISETLRFDHPVWFGAVPGLDDTYLVVEHEWGRIWLLEKRTSGSRKTLFLDLGRQVSSGGARGLLGIVLHPKFRENRKYYLALIVMENGRPVTLTLERRATVDLRRDSGENSVTILKIQAATNVHYGGGLVFGPDGYFYIGMGDTGPQQDPQGHAQNPGLLMGKMLRVDVDHRSAAEGYSIPADNPFVHTPGFRPEIWALGLREPWRFSFDPVTGELWAGDVGQDLYEEVDVIRRGENYGWNVYEGFQPFSNRYRREDEKYVPPVFAYGRKYGVSVTGGSVYRADPRSSFYGIYIFGDYQSRRIWGLTEENRVLKKIRQIGTSPERIVSFSRGPQGELYLVGYEGMIFRMDFDRAKFE